MKNSKVYDLSLIHISFEPKDWDKKLGDMLILPTKNK